MSFIGHSCRLSNGFFLCGTRMILLQREPTKIIINNLKFKNYGN